MSHQRLQTLLALSPLVCALFVLLALFLPTLQTIPNGSEDPTMIDVGETQIVLNVWGTLHATGYPLFVILGSVGVTVLRAFSISAATAPAVVSLAWGVMTLILMYALALKITGRSLLAAGGILLFGLTRMVWLHHVIAEIYTATLFVLMLLLVLALWDPPVYGRLYWLAFIGGIGVAHHRTLIFVAPALVIAVLPDLWVLIRRRPAHLLILLALGLLGLLPYAYLLLRAQSGAAWVYGEPGTLSGLWDQFIGVEASRFIGLPSSLDAVIANVRMVTQTIFTEVTPIGSLLGFVGLLVGMFDQGHPLVRRAARTLLVSGGAAFLFHCFFYTDILAALILATTLSLAFGWVLLAHRVLEGLRTMPPIRIVAGIVMVITALGFGFGLGTNNQASIAALTRDRTGIETIILAQHTPPGSTLMLAWGPRHFAIGFAKSVLGTLPGVDLVDHKADFQTLVDQTRLVTPAFTFYRQPQSWWEAQIGRPVYLSAVAPDLVQIATQAEYSNSPLPDSTEDVKVFSHRSTCGTSDIVLEVNWLAVRPPERDLSVFVHLLDSAGAVIAQDDQSAPVYGWRPLTSWLEGEIVRDFYELPRSPEADSIHYGLYTQHADGSFENLLEVTIPVDCTP